MKYTLLALACLLYSGVGFGQIDNGHFILRTAPGGLFLDPMYPGYRKCGTWEPQKPDTLDWFTVDTLGKKDRFADAREWVYSEEEQQYDGYNDLIYRPCGGGETIIYNQYRVCALTGIRQKRQRIISFKYIEAPRSDYEKVTDSLYATTAVPIKMDTLRVGRVYSSFDTVSALRYSVRQGDSLNVVSPNKKHAKK